MINEWHVRKMVEVKKLFPELDKIPRSKLFLVLLTSSVVLLLKEIGFVSTEIKKTISCASIKMLLKGNIPTYCQKSGAKNTKWRTQITSKLSKHLYKDFVVGMMMTIIIILCPE